LGFAQLASNLRKLLSVHRKVPPSLNAYTTMWPM
jgi:hypothetical protein